MIHMGVCQQAPAVMALAGLCCRFEKITVHFQCDSKPQVIHQILILSMSYYCSYKKVALGFVTQRNLITVEDYLRVSDFRVGKDI